MVRLREKSRASVTHSALMSTVLGFLGFWGDVAAKSVIGSLARHACAGRVPQREFLRVTRGGAGRARTPVVYRVSDCVSFES